MGKTSTVTNAFNKLVNRKDKNIAEFEKALQENLGRLNFITGIFFSECKKTYSTDFYTKLLSLNLNDNDLIQLLATQGKDHENLLNLIVHDHLGPKFFQEISNKNEIYTQCITEFQRIALAQDPNTLRHIRSALLAKSGLDRNYITTVQTYCPDDTNENLLKLLKQIHTVINENKPCKVTISILFKPTGLRGKSSYAKKIVKIKTQSVCVEFFLLLSELANNKDLAHQVLKNLAATKSFKLSDFFDNCNEASFNAFVDLLHILNRNIPDNTPNKTEDFKKLFSKKFSTKHPNLHKQVNQFLNPIQLESEKNKSEFASTDQSLDLPALESEMQDTDETSSTQSSTPPDSARDEPAYIYDSESLYSLPDTDKHKLNNTKEFISQGLTKDPTQMESIASKSNYKINTLLLECVDELNLKHFDTLYDPIKSKTHLLMFLEKNNSLKPGERNTLKNTINQIYVKRLLETNKPNFPNQLATAWKEKTISTEQLITFLDIKKQILGPTDDTGLPFHLNLLLVEHYFNTDDKHGSKPYVTSALAQEPNHPKPSFYQIYLNKNLNTALDYYQKRLSHSLSESPGKNLEHRETVLKHLEELKKQNITNAGTILSNFYLDANKLLDTLIENFKESIGEIRGTTQQKETIQELSLDSSSATKHLSNTISQLEDKKAMILQRIKYLKLPDADDAYELCIHTEARYRAEDIGKMIWENRGDIQTHISELEKLKEQGVALADELLDAHYEKTSSELLTAANTGLDVPLLELTSLAKTSPVASYYLGLYYKNKFDPGQTQQMLNAFTTAANSGNKPAMFELGEYEKAVTKDLDKAMQWYYKAGLPPYGEPLTHDRFTAILKYNPDNSLACKAGIYLRLMTGFSGSAKNLYDHDEPYLKLALEKSPEAFENTANQFFKDDTFELNHRLYLLQVAILNTASSAGKETIAKNPLKSYITKAINAELKTFAKQPDLKEFLESITQLANPIEPELFFISAGPSLANMNIKNELRVSLLLITKNKLNQGLADPNISESNTNNLTSHLEHVQKLIDAQPAELVNSIENITPPAAPSTAAPLPTAPALKTNIKLK